MELHMKSWCVCVCSKDTTVGKVVWKEETMEWTTAVSQSTVLPAANRSVATELNWTEQSKQQFSFVFLMQ
jgi:hypothetical protein